VFPAAKELGLEKLAQQTISQNIVVQILTLSRRSMHEETFWCEINQLVATINYVCPLASKQL